MILKMQSCASSKIQICNIEFLHKAAKRLITAVKRLITAVLALLTVKLSTSNSIEDGTMLHNSGIHYKRRKVLGVWWFDWPNTRTMCRRVFWLSAVSNTAKVWDYVCLEILPHMWTVWLARLVGLRFKHRLYKTKVLIFC